MTDDFYGVYLLYSFNEKCRGRIYIGYTVNPSRRISQHNKGRKYGGAKKTNNKGPWLVSKPNLNVYVIPYDVFNSISGFMDADSRLTNQREMALIVCGFPNDISALRFEWAWQNPLLSRRLSTLPKRKTRESLLNYHIRLLDKIISSPPWIRLPLCVHCLNTDIIVNIEELLPNRPFHIKVLQGPPSIAAVVTDNDGLMDCGLCNCELHGVKLVKCYNNECTFTGHVTCLASYILSVSDQILPISGSCPSCHITLLWGQLIKPHQIN